MNKLRKKPQNYNDDAVKELMIKYGFKRNYILMSIRGERVGTVPVKIQDEYLQMDRAAKAAIQKKVNEL
ncbi:hypothetical protein ABE545_10850 [Sphingobacterium faecium]|jgi:hypothetical protein|uniref:hypothetical protein n=1 Tax=Sphingobacterium faecium TaxID=34087 RepID=UPI0032086497